MACSVIGRFVTKKLQCIEIPVDLEGGGEILVGLPELDLNGKEGEDIDAVSDVALALSDATEMDQCLFQKVGIFRKDRGAGIENRAAQISGVVIVCHGVDGGVLTGQSAIGTGTAEYIIDRKRGIKIR